MILDGYWKSELRKSVVALRFWRRVAGAVHTGFASHQVNRWILYSAVVVRKIIEDEKWAKNEWESWIPPDPSIPVPPMPPFAILHSKMNVIAYPYVGDKDFVGFYPWADNYNADGRKTEELALEHVCNSIIHSYVWSLSHCKKKREVTAFLTASDRYKAQCVYVIKLDDWLDKIRFCLEKAHV